MKNFLNRISKSIDKAWDKIEELMEKTENTVNPWLIKNEVMIYKYTLIYILLMMYVAYKQRGYIATGGEILVALVPWVIINYIKMIEADKRRRK